MKKLSLALLALLVPVAAFAVNLGDISGRYRLTPLNSPTTYDLRIESTGAVYLTEHSVNGDLECRGSGLMEQNTLHTAFSCDNGRVFEQRIFFGGARFESTNFFARVNQDGRTRTVLFRRLGD